MPAAGSLHAHEGMSHRIRFASASPFFCGNILKDRIVEYLLGKQLLEAGVLVLNGLQPASIRHVYPATLRL